MKNSLITLSIVLVVLCLSVVQDAFAAEQKFERLFDGKSLTGWHLMNGANFIVENGVIVHKGGLGWLRSEKQYTNFILRLEFRFLDEKQDGGVFVRATKEGEKWPKSRYEIQVENTERMAKLFGAPYDLDVDLVEKVLKPTGEWNQYRIRLEGEKIEIFLNGKKVCTSDKLTRLEPGYIGLQGENGAHEYRKIWIKELP